MTDISFRAARAPDAPAIAALVRQAYGKWVAVLGREPMPMGVDYAQALQSHDFWLAFDGDLAGLIETVRADDHLWIENLCVRPDQQGRGLGRVLLARTEAQARGVGLPEIRLLTNELFASNLAFYQGYGFQIDRREPFRGGFTIYMSKRV